MPETGGSDAPRAMAVIPAARPTRPSWWPVVLAWTLWAAAIVVCLVIPWLDRRGALPATRYVALHYPASAGAILLLLGFVLLLTPTGSLPSPR
jgi:hypothetical protein